MLSFAQKGFTLVEILVAILVFVIGITAILQAFIVGFQEEIVNKRATQGTFLAQQKLEEINSLAYNQIEIGTTTESSLPPPFEKFSRTTIVSYVADDLTATTTDTGLKKVEVKVAWPSSLGTAKTDIKITTVITGS